MTDFLIKKSFQIFFLLINEKEYFLEVNIKLTPKIQRYVFFKLIKFQIRRHI